MNTTALLMGAMLSGIASGTQDGPAPSAVRELFVANCAACHGEKGDGKGTAQLEHLARSFVDGGFSYGNTPGALQRTIAAGIPGTPMPSWGQAFSEEQIRDLAGYVTELGPGLPEPPANTELVVADRPLVVRGPLPPIGSAAESHPRGLLIGTPDGFSFEYRTDDLRLLGMRQGRFVDRTDWIGRGGTALQPLGPVVFLEDGGAPQSTFVVLIDGRQVALRARLRGTRVKDGRVWIQSALFDSAGECLANVEENTRAVNIAWGSGYERLWRVQMQQRACQLSLRSAGPLRKLEDHAELDTWLRKRVVSVAPYSLGWSAEDLLIVPAAPRPLLANERVEFFSSRLRPAQRAEQNNQEQR